MKKILLSLFICVCFIADALCQTDQPTDYLSPAFHAGRREALRKLMPANSVMAVFAFPVRNYSNDVDYTYHPNPDLYYFTGYKEPHALLLIFKEPQQGKDGKTYNELFFVQKRDPQAEQWTGRRLGADGVKKELGIAMSYNGEDYAHFAIDFSGFSKIIFDVLPNAAGNENTPGDLAQLIKIFRSEISLPDNFDEETTDDLMFADKRLNASNTSRIFNYLKQNLANGKYKDSSLVKNYMAAKDSTERKTIITQGR